MFISVWVEVWPGNAKISAPPPGHIHTAIWVKSGSVNTSNGPLTTGTGCYLEAGEQLMNESADHTSIVRMVLGTEPAQDTFTAGVDPVSRSRISQHSFSTDMNNAVLRFDQVDFPAGAVAYRHTHPGPGTRYLVEGGLNLESDHGNHRYEINEAWFEDANSPVKATAIPEVPSRFIRLMVLPVEFEGKPTLTLLNAEDAQKPRLQTNTRHFDKRIVI